MPRPAHLFLADCGDLHDTRDAEWSRNPLRSGFARHNARIETGRDLCAALRAGPYAWPGGYECFFIASDGGTLSFEAVRENLTSVLWSIRTGCDNGWRVVAMDCAANCDGPVTCDHTGRVIVEGPDNG